MIVNDDELLFQEDLDGEILENTLSSPKTENKWKVLIVDDHALVRMGIRRLLEDLPDMEVVAEAESGEAALLLVKTHLPDVVLLDMKMEKP